MFCQSTLKEVPRCLIWLRRSHKDSVQRSQPASNQPDMKQMIEELEASEPMIKVNSAGLFQTLMEDESDFKSEIVSSTSLLVGLFRLIKDKRHLNGVLSGLVLLKSICTKRPQTKVLLVGLGLVPNLVDLISANSNLARPDLFDFTLQIRHEMSSTLDGRIATKECKNAVRSLILVIMSISEVCTLCVRCPQSVLDQPWKLDWQPSCCSLCKVNVGLT